MSRSTALLLIVLCLLGWPPQASCGELATEEGQSAGHNVVAAESLAATDVDYLQDIRPIFSNTCYACHGPDEASREADLRLDRPKSVFGSTASGSVPIVPGDADHSELVRRISSRDPDEVMPPVDSGKSLSADQISLIRRWVDQGADWNEHWAFVPPRRPQLPAVSDGAWPLNAIDYFILARLDQRGWRPSAEADKEILIRRVTFDLTGLPPTLADVDAFLEDNSPGAYERVVDRLLESPHYGEHMARFWLDAARYGDTHGLHLDNYREMWPYRDWVIKAFNDNLSYDQFTIEQLAGDLLPNPKLEQLVATGFGRAHVSTNEGGSIEEEVYVRNVVDQVSTMGTVFLGLTVGCAVCHDHKYDPISQKEFYQLFAFLNSLDGPALDGNVKDPAPVVSVASAQQAASLDRLREQIDDIRAKRDACRAEAAPEYSEWLLQRAKKAARGEPDSELKLADELVVHCDFDRDNGSQVTNAAAPEEPGRVVGSAGRVDGRVGGALQFPIGGYADLGNVGDVNDDESFSYGAWVRTANGKNSIVLAKTDPAELFRGYELSLLDETVTAKISRRQPGYVIKVVTKNKIITKNEWHHVFVTYDGSKRASGLTIYVDGQQQPMDVWSDALQFKGGIRNSAPLLLGQRDPEYIFENGRIDDVRVYKKRLTDAEVQAVYLETSLASLSANPDEWTDDERQALRHFYLIRHDPEFREHNDQLDKLLGQFRREELAVPTTLVFRERKTPRDAYVLIRGQYDQHGEQVQRATPAALPPMSEELPRNRLGLARWLISAENPLTSRVAVNRFWQQVFGIGLVETSEDFGNQGANPTHPLLLDWLAVDFRENGWNIKALMKQIVMSRTYRQSSFTTPALAREDPKNRLLARGPRFRLDAETLRDQALVLSGLLVPTLGGPSVKPPQPDGLWEAVGFSSSNTVSFVADTDIDKTHRRTLYTFLKRTAPAPEINTLDAPSRETTCVRRERTNTPLQALLLLNDPQYVEAARALAMRIVNSDHETIAERADFAYRLCTARTADDATVEEIVRLYEDELKKYLVERGAARKLTGRTSAKRDDDSRAAAWTIVANLLLNLDEVVTKN